MKGDFDIKGTYRITRIGDINTGHRSPGKKGGKKKQEEKRQKKETPKPPGGHGGRIDIKA